MNRKQLTDYIEENYGVTWDRPFHEDFTSAVFRHKSNKKWFALMMTIPRDKLGLSGKDPVDIVNLKCPPDLVAVICNGKTIFPAYHMNKTHWISVLLDDENLSEEVGNLLDVSYELTGKK